MSLEEQKNPQNEQIKQVVETTESFPVVKIENPQDLQELVIEKTTEAEVESDELISQGNTVIENKVKNLGLTPSYIDKGKQMLSVVSQKISDNFNKFTSKIAKIVPLAGMTIASVVGSGEAIAEGTNKGSINPEDDFLTNVINEKQTTTLDNTQVYFSPIAQNNLPVDQHEATIASPEYRKAEYFKEQLAERQRKEGSQPTFLDIERDANTIAANYIRKSQEGRSSIPTKENPQGLAAGNIEPDYTDPITMGIGGAAGVFGKGVGITGKIFNTIDAAMYGMPSLGKAGIKGLEYGLNKTLDVAKNTHKINPWAFKPNPDMLYRGIGKEGMKDALKSGVFRPNQNVAPDLVKNIDLAKRFEGTYYSPKFNVADQYGQGYIAEVPKDIANFNNRYRKGKDWSKVTREQIPIEKGKILKKDWLKGYKEVPSTITKKSTSENVVAKIPEGKKYPAGELALEEENVLKNILETKKYQHLKFVLENPVKHRDIINELLYNGHNKSITEKAVLGGVVASTAGLMGFGTGMVALEDPHKNAINRKLGFQIYPTAQARDPFITSKDTVININKNNVKFARVNETAEGDIILGGEFIESDNNSVRAAKDWLTTKDTEYGDPGRGFFEGRRKIKDIKSFYGIENGKLKVGPISEFSPETIIVANRFDDGRKIERAAISDKGYLRLFDKNNESIYQNVPKNGKLILYSPLTKEPIFISFNKPETAVEQINSYLKNNEDVIPVILDNGRYRKWVHNKNGLTKKNFKNYYSSDESRKGTPGYNIVLDSETKASKDKEGN